MNYPKHPIEAYLTRKDRLDTTGGDMQIIWYDDKLCAEAWRELSRQMVEIAAPHSNRLPKFNDLLLAIVSATAKSMAKADPADVELPVQNHENCA